MKLTHRLALLAAGTMVVTGGLAVAEAASSPAANAACYTGLTVMQAKNVSCKPKMRHWNAIKNSTSKYGAWVPPGQISRQSLCWANVVSHGVTVAKA